MSFFKYVQISASCVKFNENVRIFSGVEDKTMSGREDGRYVPTGCSC